MDARKLCNLAHVYGTVLTQIEIASYFPIIQRFRRNPRGGAN